MVCCPLKNVVKWIWIRMLVLWILIELSSQEADRVHASNQHPRSLRSSVVSVRFVKYAKTSDNGHCAHADPCGITSTSDPAFYNSFTNMYSAKSLQVPW